MRDHLGKCPVQYLKNIGPAMEQSDWLILVVGPNKYGLLTKFARSRWLDIGQVLFLRVYGPRRSPRSINSQKEGFIIWLSGLFCLRDTAGSPERARWLHLARSGSQSQCAIWVILPARGASHIIITG